MKLDHIGIAQADATAITKVFADFGLPQPTDSETLEKQGVKAYFSQLPNLAIEVITPLSEASPVAKFLQTRGPGLHHMAFLVDDIQAERTRLLEEGYRPLTPEPTLGARNKWVQFFHPKDTAGVLIELCQKQAG